MIYLPDYGLYFVHIPKNGGQSMRNAMARAGRLSFAPLGDDLGLTEAEARMAVEAGFFHPVLGAIHPAHLPSWLMATHFPRSWAALQRSKTVALSRDPRDRFLSAVLQRLREFRGAGAIRADDELVACEAARVCDWLSARDRHAELEYIHFARQVDFTDLDGNREVDAVFPMTDFKAATDWIAAETGLILEVGHDHARRQPKRWARAIQPVARFVGRNMMPGAMKRALHPLWTKSGVFGDAASTYAAIDLGADVEAFVAEYYAADIGLHLEARAFADRVGKRP